MLDRFFHLSENHTSVRTELMAGLTTFLTMSYVILINPSLLGLTGMDHGAVFVATCLAAAFASAVMGLYANYPIALAPGMGLAVYFTYSVVLGAGHSWQIALGAVFLSGILFFILSILPLRAYIISGLPHSLRVAIVAGIGIFLGIIGFKNAGIIVSNPGTFVKLGDLHQPATMLAILGFFVLVALEYFEVMGSIILSVIVVTITSIVLGYSHLQGIFSFPPSIAPTFLQMDLSGSMSLVTIVIAFLLVALFDNTGTLIGIASRAGLMDKQGRLPRMKRVLISDSTAVMIGAALGTATTTSYLESAVGVKVGGRTGLTAVTVSCLFLLALFFSPLANTIPIYATAPALIYIACLMVRAFTDFLWDDITEYIPSVLTALCMPLTFSIAEGIAFGFISYTTLKLLSGRVRDLNWVTVLLTGCFIAKYILMN